MLSGAHYHHLNNPHLIVIHVHKPTIIIIKSRDSSVGMATGWKDQVRFSAALLLHRVKTGIGAHPATCTMGTRGSFPGGKAAGS
jgi:hypothetical protein